VDLRDSPQDGPEQNADLGVGDKEHGAVIVLLDKVSNQGPVLLDDGMLNWFGSSGGSSRGGRSVTERNTKSQSPNNLTRRSCARLTL